MEFSIKSGSPEKQRSGCVVAGVFEGRKLTLAATLLDKAADGMISEILRRGDLADKAGSTLMLHKVPGLASERVLLVSLGKERSFCEKDYLAALRAACKTTNDAGIHDIALFLTEVTVKKHSLPWHIRQAVLVASEVCYRFDRFKSKPEEKRRYLERITLAVERRSDQAAAEAALTEGQAIAEGVSLARTLGNLPGNVCTPTYLAEEAARLASSLALDCEILERTDMEALGMGALLSVARGSHQSPKFIILSHRGAGKSEKPIVLVGKGITFDSGGISLKPGAEMDEMKFDMCGAASVLGAITAAASMALPLNLTAILPCVENMPGGGASRPGDIVTSLSGQTIEILNTDAEGRLILCDALSYAERFNPQTVIDVATLTGACVVALGHVACGLYANHERLARELLDAGETAGDRAWQMPLWEDYQDLLKSPFADMANIGGRWGGSITAACFLSRYTKKYDWAHLDIAGVAWKSGSDKGATGRPVPLLMHYLLQRAGRPV